MVVIVFNISKVFKRAGAWFLSGTMYALNSQIFISICVCIKICCLIEIISFCGYNKSTKITSGHLTRIDNSNYTIRKNLISSKKQ